MAITYDKLLNRDFGTLEQTYTEKDTMLYALGIGMGQDPLDEDCLQFVYEDGLKATGLKTRRELVDFALRELLRHKQQQKILSLKGKVTWEGDLAEMRTGRGQ